MTDNESETVPNVSVKKSREKSVRYPYYHLKECVDFLSIVHGIGGKKEAPVDSILSKMNLTSPETKRFKYLLSTSELFGLVEKTKMGVKPTEIGTLILYPPNGEAQRKKLLIDAFKTPQIYQKIIERYDNMILPNKTILTNIFYELKLARNVLEIAVDAFIESAQYANVLSSDNRLTVIASDDKKSITQIPLSEETYPDSSYVDNKQKSEMLQQSLSEETEISKTSSDVYRLEIPTSNGKKATISLPEGFKKEDIDILIGLLKVFTPE